MLRLLSAGVQGIKVDLQHLVVEVLGDLQVYKGRAGSTLLRLYLDETQKPGYGLMELGV